MSLLQQMTGDSEVSLLYSYHGCLTGDDTRKEERMFGYRSKHGDQKLRVEKMQYVDGT